MSSRRSRSGGMRTGNTASRWYRSSRKAPARIIAGRSRLVAATQRTLASTVCRPPTRSKRFSCSTRSSLACRPAASSPTSSRKNVPPSASSIRPRWRAWAPVKAPFSCPNSSLSSRFSDRAAQLMATNGPAARPLQRCSARAATSLPLPLSPSSSTVASVAATFRSARSTGCMAGAPWLSGGSPADPAASFGRRQAVPLDRAVHQQPQRGRALHRLLQEIERPFLHRLDRAVHRPVGGQHHHLHLGLIAAGRPAAGPGRPSGASSGR